ncbi:MAG: hypothetical protein JW788_05955 [Candidatus Omnitrophica bacterium]|nr:hypothetical protein [Candidatus Omnitrophota bacterium]
MNNFETLTAKIGDKINNGLWRLRKVKKIRNYFGMPILDAQSGNDLIADLLKMPLPVMISRFGSVELGCISNFIQIRRFRQARGIKRFKGIAGRGDKDFWKDNVKTGMASLAGFFPITDDMLERFCLEFIEHIKSIDVLGVWFNYYEDHVFYRYCPNSKLVPLRSIEPYYHNNPWSRLLQGEKVLLVHPYEESIRKQYEKRRLLFKDKDILPDFSLDTVKAVQNPNIDDTQTEFRDWFRAYESMCHKISKKDFDIAIIGAGAYGLPLASFVKKMGKKAVHMGGATQIMFGIKGRRWDTRRFFSDMYNEHWVRPSGSETPKNYMMAENGCYW